MYIESKIVRDGWTNLWGGVDSGRASNLLDPNQGAFAVNVTMRGAYPETRPPFVTPKLVFDAAEMLAYWATHETQGAHYFAPTQRGPLLVVSIGGRIFTIDVLNKFQVSEITPLKSTLLTSGFTSPPIGVSQSVPVVSGAGIQIGMQVTIGDGRYTVSGNTVNILTLRNETATAGVAIATNTPLLFPDVNPEIRPQAWMAQADKWLIIQDGQSAPILYDGALVRRSAVTGEVPTGTAMKFNEEIGRLCVALTTNEIEIGDITDPIKFTEDTYLNEGGKFRIPKQFGPITGACMIANQDRTNGQGAMLFFTEESITAFNLPPNREQWKSVQFPLQLIMPIPGATNHHSIVNVNGDVFYRGKDGLRSLALTRQDFGQWGNTPLSRELGRVLDMDDRKLLRFAVSTLFDNRLLFSCMPRKGRYGCYHEALGVLDFEGVSAIKNRVPPRFDGIWTGIKPQHIVTGNFGGEERCFIFARSESGGTQLWELLRRGNFDGDEGRIVSWIESRALDFKKPFELKKLDGFEMWIDNVVGEVHFDLKHKADVGPCWKDWGTKKVCQSFKDCDTEANSCKTVTSFRPGYRSRLGFGQPPDENDTVDNRPMRVGYLHEVRLEWRGRARVKWALAKAALIPEDANPPVETEES